MIDSRRQDPKNVMRLLLLERLLLKRLKHSSIRVGRERRPRVGDKLKNYEQLYGRIGRRLWSERELSKFKISKIGLWEYGAETVRKSLD